MGQVPNLTIWDELAASADALEDLLFLVWIFSFINQGAKAFCCCVDLCILLTCQHGWSWTQ